MSFQERTNEFILQLLTDEFHLILSSIFKSHDYNQISSKENNRGIHRT